MRTVMTVLREIQTVKSGVKDADVREALLAPLLDEVRSFAIEAKRQGELDLSQAAVKAAGSAGRVVK